MSSRQAWALARLKKKKNLNLGSRVCQNYACIARWQKPAWTVQWLPVLLRRHCLGRQVHCLLTPRDGQTLHVQ
jgi:hypothetical protein